MMVLNSQLENRSVFAGRPLYQPEDLAVVTDRPHSLERALMEDIQKWFETTKESLFFISLDGLPGAGKTSLYDVLENIVARIGHGLRLVVTPTDDHITSDRDSPARILLTAEHTPDDLFYRILYSKAQLVAVLNGIVGANGAGTVIPVPRKYDRSSGTVMPGTIVMPPGRKIVLIDGFDSTRVMNAFAARTTGGDFSCLRIAVYAHPEVSLKRALRRDAFQGRRMGTNAELYRSREYDHLVPQINGHNMRVCEMILVVR